MTDTKDLFWKNYLQVREKTPEELVEHLKELAKEKNKAEAVIQANLAKIEEICAFADKELPEYAEGFRKLLEETRRELAVRSAEYEAETQELEQKAQTLSREPDKPA